MSRPGIGIKAPRSNWVLSPGLGAESYSDYAMYSAHAYCLLLCNEQK